ncbi:MAG: CBS domain-containing protein [Desulfurococcales archaeon]|nr:CBS domain-containing protein [Desulfurococcales archaeon]
MPDFSVDLIDLIDPFVPAVNLEARIWEVAIKMSRVRRYCAILFSKDPSGDTGLYITVKRIAREIFELSEEGIVLVERGRISWALDKVASEVSMKISAIEVSSDLIKAIEGIYGNECISIINERGDSLGVVSEDSLIRVLLKAIPQDLRASDIASRPVEIIDLDAPLLEAIGVMIQRGFRRLVIMSGDKIYGIITMLDVIHRISEEHIGGDPEKLLVGSGISAIGYEEPMFVAEDSSVISLAKRLLNTRSKCVLVGDPGNLSGIITEKDLIRVIRENISS